MAALLETEYAELYALMGRKKVHADTVRLWLHDMGCIWREPTEIEVQAVMERLECVQLGRRKRDGK